MTQDDLERDIPPRPAPEHDDDRPRRKAPVFVYLALLFVAAFLMLLLAYFIQQRNESVLSSGRYAGSRSAAALNTNVSRETDWWKEETII